MRDRFFSNLTQLSNPQLCARLEAKKFDKAFVDNARCCIRASSGESDAGGDYFTFWSTNVSSATYNAPHGLELVEYLFS